MGDSAIETILLLVKENRRMHALMQSLEFRLQHCECGIYAGEMGENRKTKGEKTADSGGAEDGNKMQDQFDAFNVLDSVDDDTLLSTPL